MESLAVKRDSDKKTGAAKKIDEFNYFNPQLFLPQPSIRRISDI